MRTALPPLMQLLKGGEFGDETFFVFSTAADIASNRSTARRIISASGLLSGKSGRRMSIVTGLQFRLVTRLGSVRALPGHNIVSLIIAPFAPLLKPFLLLSYQVCIPRALAETLYPLPFCAALCSGRAALHNRTRGTEQGSRA